MPKSQPYIKVVEPYNSGKTQAQIALELGLSPGTVYCYLSAARTKGLLKEPPKPPVSRREAGMEIPQLSASALIALRKAANRRGISFGRLVAKVLEAASECIDAVLDDRGR